MSVKQIGFRSGSTQKVKPYSALCQMKTMCFSPFGLFSSLANTKQTLMKCYILWHLSSSSLFVIVLIYINNELKGSKIRLLTVPSLPNISNPVFHTISIVHQRDLPF